MLVALYEHLSQAHAAISELRHVGLTQAQIGCAFQPSDIRFPTPLRRLAKRIFHNSKFRNDDGLCTADDLCPVILPEQLQERAVQLLTRGGALISVHDQKTTTIEDLLRILQAYDPTEIAFVPQNEPKPVSEMATGSHVTGGSVKVIGALSSPRTKGFTARGTSKAQMNPGNITSGIKKKEPLENSG